MQVKGKIIKWDSEKAFGFIAPLGGGKDIFIHKNAFLNRSRIPKVNEVITFTVNRDKQGRYRAEKATFAGEANKRISKVSKFFIYLATVFIALLLVGLFIGSLPKYLVYAYIGMSSVTFFVYAYDKSKAKRDAWRIPESTLHLLALAGGWPGAAIAQQILRHKSKKQSFRVVFWITVVANCSGLIWLVSSHSDLLQLIS